MATRGAVGRLSASPNARPAARRSRNAAKYDGSTAFTIGGDWSSHYYNGLIYESDITRGLLSWEIRGDALGGTMRLDRRNPQTQEFTTS